MTNRRKTAAAIKYHHELPAPLVIARGYDHIADSIILSAKKSEVPIIKNDDLSGTLVELDPGEFIPESAFKVVAQLLAFVYGIDKGEK